MSGESAVALRPDLFDRRSLSPSAAATLRRRPRRHGSDDPLEIALRSGIAMDRHMLRNVELHRRIRHPLKLLCGAAYRGQGRMGTGCISPGGQLPATFFATR